MRGQHIKPAEVEGLVERIKVEAVNSEIDRKLAGEIATDLTALQAENERLRGERDTLDRKWTTALQLAAHAHNTEGDPGVLIDAANARAEKAEAERDAWKDNAETLAEAVSPFADVGVPSDPMSRINLTADREFVISAREALAAHAKLKGEV